MNYLFIIIMMFFMGISAFAQQGLLTGKIIDELSGKPTFGKITFMGSDGSTNKINSNANSGEFQVVVKPSIEYHIIIEKFMIVGDNSFESPNFTTYQEFNREYKVRKLEKGLSLLDFNAFSPNSSTYNKQNDEHFKFISEFLKQQIGTVIEVSISSSDSHFKATTKTLETEVKGKKKKVKVKMTEKDLASELIKERIESFKAIMKEFKIAERNIVFVEDVIINKSTSKGKKESKGNPGHTPMPLQFDTSVKIAKVSSL